LSKLRSDEKWTPSTHTCTGLALAVILLVQWPLLYCYCVLVELNPDPARLNINSSARLTADNCSSINVGCLNCRSGGNKAAVIHIINNYRLDFLALSETWFTSKTPAIVMSDISPAGYAAPHMPRSLSADWEGLSRGGGLSIVYRESVVICRHCLADEFCPSTCELELVQVCSSVITIARLRSPHLQTTDIYCASVRRRTR